MRCEPAIPRPSEAEISVMCNMCSPQSVNTFISTWSSFPHVLKLEPYIPQSPPMRRILNTRRVSAPFQPWYFLWSRGVIHSSSRPRRIAGRGLNTRKNLRGNLIAVALPGLVTSGTWDASGWWPSAAVILETRQFIMGNKHSHILPSLFWGLAFLKHCHSMIEPHRAVNGRAIIAIAASGERGIEVNTNRSDNWQKTRRGFRTNAFSRCRGWKVWVAYPCSVSIRGRCSFITTREQQHHNKQRSNTRSGEARQRSGKSHGTFTSFVNCRQRSQNVDYTYNCRVWKWTLYPEWLTNTGSRQVRIILASAKSLLVLV